MRSYKRRTVILPAMVSVDNLEFDCTVFDLSLSGMRLKFDFPIKVGAKIFIKLKGKLVRTAKVVWSANGFLGLCFTDKPEEVRAELGALVVGLS